MQLSALPLNALRAVEVVGRLGTLAAAATELNVSISAVSQHVLLAERRLDVRLFERTPSGMLPTEGGRIFLDRLTAGFREIELAVAALHQRRSEGLTVTMGPAFASSWLVPRLGRFAERHPDIRLRLIATTEVIDLIRSDVDVAIRLGNGTWPGLSAERLFEQTVFPIANPEIAGKLATIEDLSRTPVVQHGDRAAWSAWLAANGADPTLALSGPVYSDPLLALQATIAGQGVMLSWSLLAADALQTGRLVQPFPRAAGAGAVYWLVARPETVRTANFRAFRAWLLDEFRQTGETLDRLLEPQTATR